MSDTPIENLNKLAKTASALIYFYIFDRYSRNIKQFYDIFLKQRCCMIINGSRAYLIAL